MKVLKAALVGFAAFGLWGPAALAGGFEEKAKALAESKIKNLAASPKVIAAVKAQNAAYAGLSQGDIDALDKKWRAGDDALIGRVMGHELSLHLAGVRKESEGLYTEIFVMDDKGLNVAQSDKTSDYWQGDEAKWQESFGAGPGALHLSEIEEDESSQSFQMQISMPVVEGGKAIGAITVGVNADRLE